MSAATTQSWEALEQANRRRSAAMTALVCVLVFVLMLLFGFYKAFPPPEAEGILVDFGVTATGRGPRETAVRPEPTPPPPRTEAVPVTEESPTQELEESVALPEPEEERPVPERETPPEPEPEPEPEVVEEPEPVIDERFVFDREKFDFTDPGQSEGDTRPGGNMGDPSGSESDNYLGENSGLGDQGIEYGLGGRGMRSPPTTDDDVPEYGYLQIEILVDPQGNVVSAKVDRQNSTIVDAGLIRRYEEHAMRAQFQAKPGAAPRQRGYIKFTFQQR
jgi:hypothetical protein